jgi:hypothetical protein
MSELNEAGSVTHNRPFTTTLELVSLEVTRARTKFPRGRNLLTALVEEVGELASALLQEGNTAHSHKEAMQVAAVAIRIMEEQCPEFDGLSEAERQK